MIRSILILLFLALFICNEPFCLWFYPESVNIESEWYKYDALKKQLNEVIFLVALSMPFFKESTLSKSLLIVSVGIVTASVIDKMQGVSTRHVHDVIVILAFCFAGYEYYKNEKKKKNIS